MRRKQHELFEEIIKTLKDKPLSLRRLDIKVNTGSETIRQYLRSLEKLNIVALKKKRKGKLEMTYAELTQHGKKLRF